MTPLTVAGRDLRATFGSALGWGLAGGYLAVSGLLLVLALRAGEARLDGWFAPLYLVTAVLCALLTMRSLADEERTGSLELLLTSAVRPWQVVLGKALGAMAVLAVLGALTLSAPIVVASLGSPDTGPIVTGYLGLLLLGALCCAVGVAASAATGSQLVAAAASGGTLLGLWFASSVASVLPGSLGAFVRYVSPSTHVTGFLRGTVSLADLVSFVSVAALAVVVGAVVVRARRARHRGGAALRTLLVLAVVVGLNVVAARSTAQVDLSAGSRFTLASDTRDVVRAVSSPMKITAFLNSSGGEARDARFLLERYHELNDRIDYEVLDPDEQPGEARRFGISGYSAVVVQYQGRRVDAPEATELQLSTAILRAERGSTRTVCAVTGHGEPSFDDDGKGGLSQLKDLLDANAYAVRPLDLTKGAAVPSDCDLVAEIGPTVPLAEAEVKALEGFTAGAGRLLVLGDSPLDSDADLNPVLNPWGISISRSVLLDPDRATQSDPFNIVVQDFPTTNPIVRGVPSIQMAVAAGVLGQGDEANGLTVSTLAQSSDAGYLNVDDDFSLTPPDIRGPIPLAVAADSSKVEASGETRVGGDGARIVRTRVVAVANSHMVENELLGDLGNRRFIVNAIGWLAEEEQLLTVGTAPPNPRALPWTDERQRTVVGLTVFAVPGAVVGLGVAQSALRRRNDRARSRRGRRATGDRKRRR